MLYFLYFPEEREKTSPIDLKVWLNRESFLDIRRGKIAKLASLLATTISVNSEACRLERTIFPWADYSRSILTRNISSIKLKKV